MKRFKLFPLLLLLSLSACQNTALNALPPANLQAQSSPKTNQTRFLDTAQRAYRLADMQARRWDFGARLAKVEANWVEEDGRSFEWNYYFTSLGKNKALKVSSNGFQEEVSDAFLSGMIFESSWRIDSDKALTAAKEKGLKHFPVHSMELDSFLRWEIRSSDGWFTVDARSGTVSVR